MENSNDLSNVRVNELTPKKKESAQELWSSLVDLEDFEKELLNSIPKKFRQKHKKILDFCINY